MVAVCSVYLSFSSGLATGRRREERRQERRHGTADFLTPLVIFASLEQKRRFGLAGLLAKNQGGRDLIVELLTTAFGFLELDS